MINTYETSLAPPAVPPRLSRSQPYLIPASLPSQAHSKPLIRFLVCVVMVHLLLSVAAFIFLYFKYQKQVTHNQFEEKVAYMSSESRETSSKVWARMVVSSPKLAPKTAGYLKWDMKRSVRQYINYYENNWLTILQPGDYYVYSRVTFSKGDPKVPLASRIKLRKDEKQKEEVVMQAYCYLDSAVSNPTACTATQGEMMRLEKGNQLSVWVANLSLVDYEDNAISFGMHKL